MRSVSVFFAFLGFIFGTINLNAQDNDIPFGLQSSTETVAVPFLSINGNARQMAFGNIGVVSSSLYHDGAFNSNASLLANGHRYLSSTLDYTPYLRSLTKGINMVSFSTASAITERHAIGLYFRNLSISDSPRGNELALQLNYATWFPSGISIGIGAKYLNSTVPDKDVNGFAADIGLNYRKYGKANGIVRFGYSIGLGINNIGTKLYYTNSTQRDFLPTNAMLAGQFNICITSGKLRFEHDFAYQVTKLLIPSAPVYDGRPYLDDTLPPGDSIGGIDSPENINPDYGKVVAGYNPHVNVFQGMIQSFYDAPGGAREEWTETKHHLAHEFRFILNEIFSIHLREGFSYQDRLKSNGQFVSLGGGISVAGFRFDIGGWIPVLQAGPSAQKTFFVGVSYRMILGKGKKLSKLPPWNPTDDEMIEVED